MVGDSGGLHKRARRNQVMKTWVRTHNRRQNDRPRGRPTVRPVRRRSTALYRSTDRVAVVLRDRFERTDSAVSRVPRLWQRTGHMARRRHETRFRSGVVVSRELDAFGRRSGRAM